jgi:hypothetical protein
MQIAAQIVQSQIAKFVVYLATAAVIFACANGQHRKSRFIESIESSL